MSLNESGTNSEITLASPFITGKDNSRIPPDWRECSHPNGCIYFHNPTLKIVTSEDIRENAILSSVIEQYSFHYYTFGLEEHMEISYCVQSSVGPESSSATPYYLAINHKKCVASDRVSDIYDETVDSMDAHILNRRRRLYWNYLWTHSSHVQCPTRALPDALDAITWFFVDNLISGPKSTVPFSKSECEDLSLRIKELSDPLYETSVSRTVFLSWFLREVCSFRDSEEYGRLTMKRYRERVIQRATRILVEPPSTPALFMGKVLTNTIFFGIPWTYLAQIKNTLEYHGRFSGMQTHWGNYVDRLVREYTHFLLISTVLLSATVGLLTFPEINIEPRVAATISAFASLSSIIVGVFSIWCHQANQRTVDYFTYMRNAQHAPLGLHGHALLLSLPPVLLVWAIVAFCISMVMYTAQGISDPLQASWVALTLGVFCLMLTVVLMAIYTFAVIWKYQQGGSVVRFRWIRCCGRKTKSSIV